MNRRYYLDVAAVRIQQWLRRTPDLKGWRGASAALSALTAREFWQDRLPAEVRWNDEAGDVDGVVSLCTVDGLSEQQAAGQARIVTGQVAARLRQELPALMFQAAWAPADNYGQAYELLWQRRTDGLAAVTFLPAPPQLVLARPCGTCRVDPAIAEGAGPEGLDLCADCLVRYPAAGSTAAAAGRAPRAQQRLRTALAARGQPVTGFPATFDELAQQGQRSVDDAATHVALVYADGNRVGQFLRAAASQSARGGRPGKAEIVTAIDSACIGALAQACLDVFAGDTTSRSRPPILAHVAGGDDVLVSVPASSGWPLVWRLLTAFSDLLRDGVSSWPAPARRSLPSMSAGLVFHHRTAPFPDMVRLARGALEAAKRDQRGQHAAVSFVDATSDGGTAPAWRAAVPVTDLARCRARLDEVAGLPAAHRSTLLSLLRLADGQQPPLSAPDRATNGGYPRPDSGPGPESATAALARRVVDLGHLVLWRVVRDVDDTAEVRGGDVKTVLEDDPAARLRLRTALDLARWWPPGPTATPPAHQDPDRPDAHTRRDQARWRDSHNGRDGRTRARRRSGDQRGQA